jgi:hypothetical protein
MHCILRDQEAELAGREHRACALLRAEKLDCVRHELLVDSACVIAGPFFTSILLDHDPTTNGANTKRRKFIRAPWQPLAY